MVQDSADAWAERANQSVFTAIKRERKAQGLSVQQLSDRCTELGYPIARRVLSKMENGERSNISIPELMAIAEALGVAPLDLIYSPYSAGDAVDRLPNNSTIEEEARDRFIKYQRSGSSFPSSVTAGTRFLLDNWLRLVGDCEQVIQRITNPETENSYLPHLDRRLMVQLGSVQRMQRTLDAEGVSAPPLPESIAEVMEQRADDIAKARAELDERHAAAKGAPIVLEFEA